jgi:N-acetylmuramoyl-L-alanine amidase
MKIGHDPGHGFKGDTGCVHNGVVESEYVLTLAQDVAAGIPWVTHTLLRSAEEAPAYAERAQSALKANCDLVFLHHVDAAGPADSGLKAFFDPGDEPGFEVAGALSRCSPTRLWRGKTQPFAATERGWPRVRWCLEWYRQLGLSAVLIEWGYSTNPADAETLLDPKGRPAQVAAVMSGIARAMELR